MPNKWMMWWRSSLMLTVLGFATGACAADSSSVTSASGSDSPAQLAAAAAPQASVSDTPASERYLTELERRGGKVRIEAPPASYTPRISRSQAFDALNDQNLFPETTRSQVADIRLAVYSNNAMNVVGEPIYLSHPVWVIRYDNVPNEMGHVEGAKKPGALGPDLGANADVPVNVNVLVFIDADTGQYLNNLVDPVENG